MAKSKKRKKKTKQLSETRKKALLRKELLEKIIVASGRRVFEKVKG